MCFSRLLHNTHKELENNGHFFKLQSISGHPQTEMIDTSFCALLSGFFNCTIILTFSIDTNIFSLKVTLKIGDTAVACIKRILNYSELSDLFNNL